MNPSIQVHIYIFLTLSAVLGQSDNDEGRPYEFGFTIDGEQHRHEKKDQKGIIQGEFGFITADGIYHVTVYATDENGNFKILSMRNIRISAPLDGSPLTGEISPEAGKYLRKSEQPQHSKITPKEQRPQVNQLQVNQNVGPALINQQPIETVTKSSFPYVFTTLPTIKPACGGCGYVTTQSSSNKQFQFQNPAFKESAGALENKIPLKQQQGVPLSNKAKAGQGLVGFQKQTHAIPLSLVGSENSEGKPSGTLSGINQQTRHQAPIQKTFGSSFDSHSKQGNNQNSEDNLETRPQFSAKGTYGSSLDLLDTELLPPGVSNQRQGGLSRGPLGPYIKNEQGKFISSTNGESGSPGNGAVRSDVSGLRGEVSTLPPIQVSDNKIHVSGSKPIDIPIKDKYPGMVDGLPNGIEETDIKDILYRFHYTVGFHGHYEKGLKNGAKVGGYFVNGRDGISRIVTYVADENGYRPKFKFINLGLDSPDTPKEGSEKQFGLKSFEFVWYPIE